jgi:hypothetical protein
VIGIDHDLAAGRVAPLDGHPERAARERRGGVVTDRRIDHTGADASSTTAQ